MRQVSKRQTAGWAAGAYFVNLFRGQFACRQAQEDAIGHTPPQPHLYLHGENDGCMGVEIAHMAVPFLPPPQSLVEIVSDAGHFLQLERPKVVNELIIEFLT